eukprot:Cvel_32292.t2-p1 / transcript=Cvel_32292.t2 / gene=Cvel_32292 / organism=Chromera_velia_CCMP2878 / gene_product=hypothetical protein / transcript_product=hypothetical protein / location=Cvel_scaffold4993:3982-4356(+) / protein_length=125 / sequence_SO=supercontig / SO=protein_coding / is_pseudo=false
MNWAVWSLWVSTATSLIITLSIMWGLLRTGFWVIIALVGAACIAFCIAVCVSPSFRERVLSSAGKRLAQNRQVQEAAGRAAGNAANTAVQTQMQQYGNNKGGAQQQQQGAQGKRQSGDPPPFLGV